MGWRFRRSVKLFPGVRLNFGKNGISTTVGVRGFSVNYGKRGAYLNAGIPGTGLSYREKLSPGRLDSASPPPNSSGTPDQGEQEETLYLPPSLQTIASSDAESLSSPSLAALQDLVNAARVEKDKLLKEKAALTEIEKKKIGSLKTLSFALWAWAFRRKIAERSQELKDIRDESLELEEQIGLCTVPVGADLTDAEKSKFQAMCEAFPALASCERIWDFTHSGSTDQKRERTIANTTVVRKRVPVDIRPLEFLRADFPTMRFGNANGLDIYVFPGFLLMLQSDGAFFPIAFTDLTISFVALKFQETEAVPKDAPRVGTTWFKVNRDGSPDKRYKGNYEIPVMGYAQVDFKTPSGLNESYCFSNPQSVISFFQPFVDLIESLQKR